MFRLTNNLSKLSVTIDAFTANSNNLQSLRWRRKPRWIPTAKTKIFKIPPRPIIPIEEAEELKRLFNNYRTQIKSIRRYLTYKYATRLLQSVDVEQHKKEFEEDFRRCHDHNEQWNAALKTQREIRYTKDLESDINIAKERIVVRSEINARKFEDAEELVRKQKEVSHTFITPETLNDAIEKALVTEIDYNFAIDSEGTQIIGRETVKEDNDQKEIISMKQ